jgi:phospholipase/carboxylesterase
MLDYQIRSAEGKAEKNPTIILIHGYGSNAEDLFSFAPYLPKSHTIIALQAPLSMGQGSYAWYPLGMNETGSVTSDVDQAWNVVDLLLENIEALSREHALAPDDISLFGFSQGAILSWALAFKYPEKVRRIIALSGLIHESVPMQKKPEFLAYAAHGTEDTVIKIDQAREYILPLSQKYDEIEYHEFNDGHTVSQENFTALMKWIDKTNL